MDSKTIYYVTWLFIIVMFLISIFSVVELVVDSGAEVMQRLRSMIND